MISVFQTPQLQTKVKTQKKNKKIALQSAITRWKAGDTKAASQLLQYLKPTISSALKSFAPGQQDALRIQAAKLALSSLNSYDPQKNVEPSTFVFNNLQRLSRLRRQRQNIIHIPQDTVYKYNIIQQKATQLQDQLGRQPSIQQLADAVGMSQAKIQKIMSKSTSIINDSSAVSAITGQSTFATKNTTDADYIDYTYRSMGPVQQKIMQWSLGLKGKPILSNAQIARRLHLSPGAVSQRRLKINNTLSAIRGLI